MIGPNSRPTTHHRTSMANTSLSNAAMGPLSRRRLLQAAACGFGFTAFSHLAQSAQTEGPMAPKSPHFTPRAKRVIFMFMQGGPAQMDLLDYKPELEKLAKQGFDTRVNGQRMGGKLLPSPWKFTPAGECGLPVSELLPETARHADQLCVINSMRTDNPAHPQATLMLHTGAINFVRPSMGSWIVYGLGTENQNLPGFVTINPVENLGGVQNYGSAFLPATYQGTRVNVGPRPMANLRNQRLSSAEQRQQLELIQSMNHDLLEEVDTDPALEGIIESYELAFRMQSEVPELMDLSDEPQAVQAKYGIGDRATEGFGKQCLMARRLAEAGVRFIEITHRGWDQHNQLSERLPANCRAIDRPIGALLDDLKQRDLLKDTLVIWGGEFGRTPVDQGNGNGRRHNPSGFTMWMAGGGVKGGLRYGATDPSGYDAVDNPVHIHDLHATVLHLLGFDHTRLTFPYSGRDFRLTDVHGEVVQGILA
ncbi:MAG: DUF1501 domain-containing protein [Pirellulales bacterium]